jgi:hypothetical protein
VGTGGGMMGFRQPDGSIRWGMITNAHVTGLDARPGLIMGQPDFRRPFGGIIKVHEISRQRGAKNLVDLAQLFCEDSEGKLTCYPEQVTLGRLGAGWRDAVLRMDSGKDGRTTGGTKGICVGIKGVSQVGYGSNDVRRLEDLDFFAKPNGGDVSQAGDSGSMILDLKDNYFISLLFAGGGGQTIGCAARNVIAACNGVMPKLAA